MTLYVATACLPDAADGATALVRLAEREITHVQLSPGRPPGKDWQAAAERFSGRLLLHDACLDEPAEPRWNLAAADEELRKRAVARVGAMLRLSAELGAPFYSLQAGYALTTTLSADGEPLGPPQPRAKALERLCRSLDTLASLADSLRLGLWLENAPLLPGRPESAALFQLPGEIRQTFERLQAPPLGLYLDVAHWLLTCHARRWEPEPVLEELGGWVRAIALARSDGRSERHLMPVEGGVELAIARAAGAHEVPVVLAARALEPGALAEAIALATHALAP